MSNHCLIEQFLVCLYVSAELPDDQGAIIAGILRSPKFRERLHRAINDVLLAFPDLNVVELDLSQ